MPELKVIAIDAMGGDHAPLEIVKGAVNSLKNPEVKILLIGIEDQLKQELSKYKYDQERLEIIHATEVIATDETPTSAIKKKKDSSLVVGMHLLKEKKAEALVSAGNTGALLTGSTLIVGRIPGISRPALGTLLPNEKGLSFLIDSGANVDCKPQYLLQFAQMGAVYVQNVLNIENPKVGLVNIGAEKEKGNALAKEAYELLEASDLNFIGNLEARDISKGDCHVIVCDGFVGNVILKYSEGFASSLMKIIKKEMMAGTLSKIGGVLAKGAFGNLKKMFDYSEVGGAPFIGLKSLVVKAHGSSDAKAIEGAVNQAYTFISNQIIEKIEKKI